MASKRSRNNEWFIGVHFNESAYAKGRVVASKATLVENIIRKGDLVYTTRDVEFGREYEIDGPIVDALHSLHSYVLEELTKKEEARSSKHKETLAKKYAKKRKAKAAAEVSKAEQKVRRIQYELVTEREKLSNMKRAYQNMSNAVNERQTMYNKLVASSTVQIKKKDAEIQKLKKSIKEIEKAQLLKVENAVADLSVNRAEAGRTIELD